MLTVTENASAQLNEMLDEAEAPENVAIRFVVKGSDLGLQLDSPRPGDATFDHEGRTVLVMEQQLSDVLTDKTLDVQQTQEGPQLSLV